ncbi:MAG: hypothetical protein IV108_01495 [Burkholderiales bacterium]|nr:hypothetical protein [Burkholderiales bacterium]
MKLITIILLALPVLFAGPAVAEGADANGVKSLRAEIRADKKQIVAANLPLTEAEAKRFWPVYENYQNELQTISAKLEKIILTYADAYKKGAVPDDTAKRLTEEAMAVEEAEVKLKRRYLSKFSRLLPAAKVARYFQIENKVRAEIKYEFAKHVPLIQ